MSNELEVAAAAVPEVAPATPVVTEPVQVEINPTEQSAREQGWVSKEEWVELGKDADEWRPAKEFVDRGELYKSIHSTKRELKQTQAALNALQLHHKMVYEKAYQSAVQDLKLQKRQAIREGDLEALEDIEDRMDNLQQERVREVQQLNQVQASSSVPPAFQEFVDRNPWYTSDKDMRKKADFIGFDYLNEGGNRELMLQHVEREMKKQYPEKFGIKRASPNPVAPTSRASKPAKEADMAMAESEREAMRTFVRMGVMTEAQYKAELKKAKERG